MLLIDLHELKFNCLSLGSLTNDYKIPLLYNNKNNELYFKTPKLYFKKLDNDMNLLAELNIFSDNFYKKFRQLEDYIINLVYTSKIVNFNLNSLKDMYKSCFQLPESVKLCPNILLNIKDAILYDISNNQITSEDLIQDDEINCIIKINYIYFNKTSWGIYFNVETLKKFDEISNNDNNNYKFIDDTSTNNKT